jgi:hypothetical protein
MVSSGQIPAAGYYTVTVLNPAPPAGGLLAGNYLTVTVNNDKPTLQTYAPSTAVVGTGAITVTIHTMGNSLMAGAVGYVDGSPRTSDVNNHDIDVGLTVADVRSVGNRRLTVQNPDPTVGPAGPLTFAVTPLTVSLAPVSPSPIVITLPTTSQLLTVTIDNASQVEDDAINLTSSNPAVLSVPATVTLTHPGTSVGFNAATHGLAGTVTITASLPASLGGDVSNVVTVTVRDEPITGLSAANSGPTALANATAFTATKTAGSNVTYKWNFGDTTAETSYTTTATVTHTNTFGGSYTAVVTATNSLGTVVTATTPYVVITPTVSLTPTSSTIQLPSAGAVLTATISHIQSGNTTIGLASSNSVTASVPASVILLAGQTTVTFTVTGNLSGTVAITATLPANAGGSSGSATVHVVGASGGTAPRNDRRTALGARTRVFNALNPWVINLEPPVAIIPRKSEPTPTFRTF